MVAAQNDRNCILFQNLTYTFFDCCIGWMNVAWGYIEVTNIAAFEAFHDVYLKKNIVWFHHCGNISNCIWTKTRTGTERACCIEWSTGNNEIQSFSRINFAHSHKCSHIAESWGGQCACRLFNFRHIHSPFSYSSFVFTDNQYISYI